MRRNREFFRIMRRHSQLSNSAFDKRAFGATRLDMLLGPYQSSIVSHTMRGVSNLSSSKILPALNFHVEVVCHGVVNASPTNETLIIPVMEMRMYVKKWSSKIESDF